MKKTFTLVELIIVIAIIAILAVTAFLLLTKRLSKARDSSRASNLANIENSLQISLTEKSSLPKPDSYTLIYASGTSNVVGYQGYFGEGVKDAVGNINSAPKDGDDYFTYYLNADLNKYQLASFMENEIAYNPNVVSAVDYSSRYINVRGDKLGLLTDTNKSPLQSLGLTGLDISTGSTTYIAYMDNSTNISGTGKQLFTYYYSQSKSLLNNKDVAKYDSSLVFYSDMETLTGTLLADLSQYGNNGVCLSGSTSVSCGGAGGPQFVQGQNGKAIQFDGIDDSIKILNNSSIKPSDGFTVFIKYYFDGSDPTTYYSLFRNGKSYNDGKGIYIRLQNFDNKTNPDNICLTVFTGASNQNRTTCYSHFIERGNWGNLITRYNKKSIIIYKDGNIGTLNDFSNEAVILNDDLDAFIGTSDFVRYFKGKIDEVRIYNRALFDDEIKALYDATK